MYQIIFFITAYLIIDVNTRFIPENFLKNKHDNNTHTVEETQHATCSISSEDIAATANATITRQLKGICTSAHLDNRLDILEKIIIRELNDMKELLLYPDENNKFINKNYNGNKNNYNGNKNNYNGNKYNNGNIYNTGHNDNENTNTMKISTQLLKSYENMEYKNEINTSPVEKDIIKNNMTAMKDDTGIIFNYYWKINNIANILDSNTYIDSGAFHFSGYHLFVRFISRNQNVLIRIVGTGDFELAHQFGLINQQETDYDVYSPIIINCKEKLNRINVQCEGYKLSQDTILTKNLIKNDILIIKLMIYL